MNIAVNGGIVSITDMQDKYYSLAETKLFRYNPTKIALEGRLTVETLTAIEHVNGALPKELRLLKQRLITQREAVKAALRQAEPKLIVECDINATLLKHQIRGVNAAMLHFDFGQATDRGFAYFFDMGTGKTLTTIALMSALYNHNAIKRALVVCPSSLIGSWAQEIEKFATFDYEVAQLMGEKSKRIALLEQLQYANGLQIAIINYESTFRDGLEEALTNYNADLIVCDESQRIKNHAAQQSKAMHRLGRRAKFRVILSGTPIQNAAIDIFSQYKFLDPTIFGQSFYSFRNYYAIMGGYQNHQIIGYRNMEKMTEKIYSCGYRVLLKDCVDLPEQIFEDRTLTFSPKERAIYDRLKRDGVTEIEKQESENIKVLATTVLAQITRLRQLTGGFAVDADGGDPQRVNSVKLNALEDIIDDYVIETGEKLVVFATFRAELSAIEQMLKRKKVGYGLIHGDIDPKKRADIVADFQNNPDTKVFVAQTATAGLGITLTAAHTTVFYSMSYNAAEYDQAVARTYRIGQTEKTTYIHLIIKGTIDETILRIVKNKITLADGILNKGWRVLFE